MPRERNEETDDQLIGSIRQGDRMAREKLIQRHSGLIRNLVRRYIRHADEQQDVVQDIFVLVLDKIPSFEHRSSFKTWLYRITVNRLLDIVKRKDKILFVSLEEDLTLQSVSQSYSAENITHYYAGLMLCLDKEQYATVAAADFFKLEHTEASALLNISPENFRKKLSRSRKDLRNWMQNKCSLVKPGGACQCVKKAKKFTGEGWVDPATQTFTKERIEDVFAHITAVKDRTQNETHG